MRLATPVIVPSSDDLDAVLTSYSLAIRFHYDRYDKTDKAPRQTRAVVELESVSDKIVLTGYSKRHPNDNHCREVARKHALTDALKSIPSPDLRRRVWEVWLNRPSSAGTPVCRP